MKATKAILIGGSGRVGQALARELSVLYDTVILIARKQPTVMTANMHIYLVNDFQSLPTLIESMAIGFDTHAFSCLGVTFGQVASQDEFYRVNVLYNVQFAQACHKKGVKRFFYLSKAGVDQPKDAQQSAKADVERELKNLGFEDLVIFRPYGLTPPKQKSLLGLSSPSWLLHEAKSALLSGLGLTQKQALTPNQVAASMAFLAYQLNQAPHQLGPKIIKHEQMQSLNRLIVD